MPFLCCHQFVLHKKLFISSSKFLVSMANSFVAYYLFASINIGTVLQNQQQQKNPNKTHKTTGHRI